MKGNRIKELREEKNLKQEQLAKILSISTSAIGMYERDAREPNDELTLKFANFFNVSTDYLLGKTNTRNYPDIQLDEMEIAFATGIKGLNRENKEIAKSIIEGLLAKQNNDEKNNTLT